VQGISFPPQIAFSHGPGRARVPAASSSLVVSSCDPPRAAGAAGAPPWHDTVLIIVPTTTAAPNGNFPFLSLGVSSRAQYSTTTAAASEAENEDMAPILEVGKLQASPAILPPAQAVSRQVVLPVEISYWSERPLRLQDSGANQPGIQRVEEGLRPCVQCGVPSVYDHHFISFSSCLGVQSLNDGMRSSTMYGNVLRRRKYLLIRLPFPFRMLVTAVKYCYYA
jgi:hypothetical protein